MRECMCRRRPRSRMKGARGHRPHRPRHRRRGVTSTHASPRPMATQLPAHVLRACATKVASCSVVATGTRRPRRRRRPRAAGARPSAATSITASPNNGRAARCRCRPLRTRRRSASASRLAATRAPSFSAEKGARAKRQAASQTQHDATNVRLCGRLPPPTLPPSYNALTMLST